MNIDNFNCVSDTLDAVQKLQQKYMTQFKKISVEHNNYKNMCDILVTVQLNERSTISQRFPFGKSGVYTAKQRFEAYNNFINELDIWTK